MPNSDIDTIIERFLNETASAEEERQLSQWAKENADNANYLKQQQKLYHQACLHAEVDPDTEAELSKLMQSPEFAKSRSRSLYMRYASAAAAAVIALFVWSEFRSAQQTRLQNDIVATVEYAPTDSIQQLGLADGSSVSLATGSALNAFAENKGNRAIQLTGKAYFEVAHDTAHPFTVTAGRIRVTVLGTKFEVRQDPAGTTTVSVTEGKVRVEDTATGFSTILTAMQQVCVGNSAAPQTIALRNENYRAWLTGQLEFADVPLSEALGDIGGMYGCSYRIASHELDSLRLNVSFDRRSRTQVENILQAMIGANFVNADTAIVVSKRQ